MDRQKVLDEFHKMVTVNSLKARNLIKKLDYKKDHYLLQCIAQTYLDECRFEKDGTQRVYLEKRKWRLAERYIIKAFTIKPNCADVLWVMGKVRQVYNQTDIAIYCFKKIIKLGVKGIVYGGCKLELPLGQELINDSKFELYSMYHETNPSLSKRYLSMYNKGLEKGICTIYKPLKKFLIA